MTSPHSEDYERLEAELTYRTGRLAEKIVDLDRELRVQQARLDVALRLIEELRASLEEKERAESDSPS